jgi:hypothetical protein
MSDLSLDEMTPNRASSAKTIKIALAIIFGLAAVAGAALLAAGTVGSFGTLPFILVLGAAIISSIVSGGLIYSAKKEPICALDCPTPSLTPTEIHVQGSISGCEDLCKYIDEGTRESRQYLISGEERIHPQFGKDCVRDRLKSEIEGKTFADRFPFECAQLEILKESLDESDDGQDQLDRAKAEFEAKIVASFAELAAEKLGPASPATAHISAAFSQNSQLLLDEEMQKIARAQYNGRLIGPLCKNTMTLEFPADRNVAAKITVHASGEFSQLERSEGDDVEGYQSVIIDLEPSCGYKGTATIVIDHQGRSTIETDIHLFPKN